MFRLIWRPLCSLLLTFSICLPLSAAAPQFEWATGRPEEHGLSDSKIEQYQRGLAIHGTSALLIIRDDCIVHEWYRTGQSTNQPHYSASTAKALVGGMSAALALNDGLLTLDDPAAKFVPQWRDDPRKSRITLRQLGSHTSGLEDAEEKGRTHEQLNGWKGDFWKRLPPPRDPFTAARDITPVIFEPGERKQYSNPGMAMLSYALTVALKDAPEKDLRTLLRDRIMRPIGVTDAEWSIGYGETVTVEGLPLVAPWGGGSFTARAAARIGRLMLRQGNWEGRQLIKASAVQAVTTDAGTPGNCGIGWWSNNDGSIERLPRDSFWGSGAGHQIVLVVPSLNLIVVRNGVSLDPGVDYDRGLKTFFFDPLLEVLAGSARRNTGPYPPSPVIKELQWAPKETVKRAAKGSDNWPITWGDDDLLYTAYGDGNGFEPYMPGKLSLGFARIRGNATDFRGENIPSPSGERLGDGRAGLKASGLLCVNGVLYLWTRNATNSQLASSADHARSWVWADWKFTTSFGCPTFLNFGRDYAGARDEFVYIYSPDSDNAYDPAHRMVLARAPRNEILKRDSYQFFSGFVDGRPEWTQDIAKRDTVFSNPGHCGRSAVTYNPFLKRYLLCQALGRDSRFEGGFGIYDAPEPWGPWTTVYFTEKWDMGPGESSSFPVRWMSADGSSAFLVFSGNDSFSVREARFILLSGGPRRIPSD